MGKLKMAHELLVSALKGGTHLGSDHVGTAQYFLIQQTQCRWKLMKSKDEIGTIVWKCVMWYVTIVMATAITAMTITILNYLGKVCN